jgi:hypothetical protein
MSDKPALVNPLDSMKQARIRGEVVFMEATFAAIEQIKEQTGIDFMDPARDEKGAEEIYKQLQHWPTLLKVLSAFLTNVGDDDVREAQKIWTPDKLKFKLSVSNLWDFVSSVYKVLNVANDTGDEPETVGPTVEGEANPQKPEGEL